MTAKRLVIAVFSLLLLALAAYAVYWRVFATRIPDIIATWAEQQRARGYAVSYGKIAVTGFPGAFRVTVADPVLARADQRAFVALPVVHQMHVRRVRLRKPIDLHVQAVDVGRHLFHQKSSII